MLQIDFSRNLAKDVLDDVLDSEKRSCAEILRRACNRDFVHRSREDPLAEAL